MKRISEFFTIVGVLLSFVTTFFGYLVYVEDKAGIKEDGVRRLQVAAAEVFAPSDYSLTPKILDVILEGSNFTVSVGDTALMTQTQKLPFAVTSGSNDSRVSIVLNGRGHSLYKGSTLKVPYTDCYMWLYHISNPNYTFQLRCDQRA